MSSKTARFRRPEAVSAVDAAGEVPAEWLESRQDAAVEAYSHVQGVATESGREQPFPTGLPIASARRPHGVIHGFHSKASIALSNPMGCDTCVLAAIKKKNPRHPLACKEARKHARCSILERRQTGWAADLVEEIRNGTGAEPTAIQRGQVEQIIRLRGRLFALEVYLSAAGLVDVRTGEPRAIVDRMTSLENALGRATGELRSSISAARESKHGPRPTLAEYLEVLAASKSAPLAVEDTSSKGALTERENSLPEQEGSDGE